MRTAGHVGADPGRIVLKRLTPRFRKWLLHRQRRVRIMQINTVSNRGPAAWARRRAEFEDVRRLMPPVVWDYDTYPTYGAFTPPTDFSFERNYEATLAFILDFRRYFFETRLYRFPDGQRRRLYADFAHISRIDAGAGLVLAAEIDRFVKSRPKQRHEVHDHLWHEDVFGFFSEAGLFDLLHIDPRSVHSQPSVRSDRKTLRLRSGLTKSGAIARDIRDQVESLSGKSIAARPHAYTAIAEALANVGHAYPSWFRSWPWKPSRRWWTLGFWDASRNIVGLQLYDQGAGIPATLPRQLYWPRLMSFLDQERRASGLIKAGLDYGRTSTGQPGRGKGLAEMADWIETSGSGFLRILSGDGEVTYRPGGKVDRRDFDAPFCGTLIEWEVSLNG